jgi:hypothetical protein
LAAQGCALFVRGEELDRVCTIRLHTLNVNEV